MIFDVVGGSVSIGERLPSEMRFYCRKYDLTSRIRIGFSPTGVSEQIRGEGSLHESPDFAMGFCCFCSRTHIRNIRLNGFEERILADISNSPVYSRSRRESYYRVRASIPDISEEIQPFDHRATTSN